MARFFYIVCFNELKLFAAYFTAFARRHAVVVAGSFVSAHFARDKRFTTATARGTSTAVFRRQQTGF